MDHVEFLLAGCSHPVPNLGMGNVKKVIEICVDTQSWQKSQGAGYE